MKKLQAILLMLGMAGLAFAQPGPGMGEGMERHAGNEREPMHGRQDVMAKLNLSEDQQNQMQKLRIDLQKKQATVQSKIRLARLDIEELFMAATPDKGAIEKKMKEVSDLQYQEKLNGLDHMFAVKAILTPEQQKLWKEHMRNGGPELRERFMDRMGDHR
jgi:Spy/CpxP family protein refolding chaperone